MVTTTMSLVVDCHNNKTLTILFTTYIMQTVMECPDYPITNYAVVVEESDGNRTLQATSPVTCNSININLMENQQYRFYVIATNQFGSSDDSTSMEICESHCTLDKNITMAMGILL